MNFAYDDSYTPPAPSVAVHLGLPGGPLRVGPGRAFVDTGADACIVPARFSQQLEAQVSDRSYVRGQWGDRSAVDVFFLGVAIGGTRVSPVQVVADEQGDEIIVGRNVLNRLAITLDGPREALEVHE